LFPLSHFLSLTFQRTSIIGLNKDLRMPKIEFLSNAAPSVFDYPPPMEEKKGDKKTKKLKKQFYQLQVKRINVMPRRRLKN
jgi:hypothetical protein